MVASDGITAVAAIVAALTVIGTGVGWIWVKAIRPIYRWVANVHDVVTRELERNGGSSMLDLIHQVDQRGEHTSGELHALRREFREYVEDDLTARARTVRVIAAHVVDGHGGRLPDGED